MIYLLDNVNNLNFSNKIKVTSKSVFNQITAPDYYQDYSDNIEPHIFQLNVIVKLSNESIQQISTIFTKINNAYLCNKIITFHVENSENIETSSFKTEDRIFLYSENSFYELEIKK